MQLISEFSKGICFLLCVIDIFSKYAWVIPLKNKKGNIITNAFQKILDESNCKPSKIWVDKGSEFYNRSMKSFQQHNNNNIQMYSAHNERKSVVAERFIRTLKNKICKYMTSTSKSMYIDKLDHIVNKYSKTYDKTIKMKPVDVNRSMHIDFDKENNKEGPKFKNRDNVISDLKGEQIAGTFYKKELQKINQNKIKRK